MDVIEIPFVETVGIKRGDSGEIMLPFQPAVTNHVQTIHAAALFSLAETASGDALLSLFPDLGDSVIPVLRDSQLKYKRPAQGTITAYTDIEQENIERFIERLSTKGRALLDIDVTLQDEDGLVTCCGSFNWYVMRK
jgi:acyl-coenzyme A thioesterase PaaI-like protein